jgi:hypothetical protein
MNAIHIGGCILNRSPNDMHGNMCDCYKIQFIACAFGITYEVRMCREWVRYMAQRERIGQTHDICRTSSIVKKSVIDALRVSDDWFRWHYVPRPRSKAGKEVAGNYEKLPTHFVEVVMDNKYGRIEQMIPCHIAANWSGHWSIGGNRENMWTGWTKGYRDVIALNAQRHRNFMRALERACGRKEACKLTGITDRKLLVAMTELLTIKTKEHETSEQQEPAPLPV